MGDSSSLRALRADFDRNAGRSLSLPLAGMIIWAVVGIVSLFLPFRTANLVLLFASGAIFPLGLLLSQLLREQLLSNENPLAKLMGLAVLMVNLLWALHLTFVVDSPTYVPLSLGIGLGIHWIVFSWIIGHPLGIIHAVLRTGLVTALWWLFPDNRIAAVAIGVVVAYAYSIYALSTRRLNQDDAPAQP